MKITPIEIRQHTFDKGLRGYRTEDVDAFLSSLSQEWERISGEQKMLKMQLELAERELNKLKEIELTLFRTLKNAEDNSSQITDQATRAAEQHIAEARQKADEMLADAKKRSVLMVQDAENQARYLKDNILNDLKAMEHDFKAMERYKDNLMTQIRTLASNAVDSVERFERKFAKGSFQEKIADVTGQLTPEPVQKKSAEQPQEPAPKPVLEEAVAPVLDAEKSEEAIAQTPLLVVDEPTHQEEAVPKSVEPEPTHETVAEVMAEVNHSVESYNAEPEPQKTSGSFFDQI
jgi:cell division initiation protein